MIRHLAASRLLVLADKLYKGAGKHARVPHRGRASPLQKDANRAHAQLRSPAERANARSRSGASCGNSAATPGAPDCPPTLSTSFKPARSKDETLTVLRL
jgi:hypothetical protein